MGRQRRDSPGDELLVALLVKDGIVAPGPKPCRVAACRTTTGCVVKYGIAECSPFQKEIKEDGVSQN